MIEELLRLLEEGMRFNDAVRRVYELYGRTGKVKKENEEAGEEV